MSLTTFKSLTVIIPTMDEAENISLLVDRLKWYVPRGTTILFVDDSDNEMTAAAIKAAAPACPDLYVKLEHRSPDVRNGLAGAVIDGIRIATSDLVIVMDADGQHPPQTIPSMVNAAEHADLVVASRYCPGGSASGLHGPIRHAVSRLCTWVAKGLFPYQLRAVSDPMSGCFAVRRRCIDTDRLQASGFKVLLEIMVRHPKLTRTQVPLRFAARTNGASKGSLKVGGQYLRQLNRLRTTSAIPQSATSALQTRRT